MAVIEEIVQEDKIVSSTSKHQLFIKSRFDFESIEPIFIFILVHEPENKAKPTEIVEADQDGDVFFESTEYQAEELEVKHEIIQCA